MNINRKGFTNIVLIITVVVLLVGTVGYFTFINKSEPIAQQSTPTQAIPTPTPATTFTSTSSTPTESTEDWKTYRNEQYGIELKYPGDWTTESSSDPETFAIFNSPENHKISLDIRARKIRKIEDYSYAEDVQIGYYINDIQWPPQNNPPVSNLKKSILAGYESYIMTISSKRNIYTTSVDRYTVMVKKGSGIFVIQFGHKAKLSDLSQKESKILSTFKFTN